MTFKQIRYFLILSEELHFWKAAEKSFISQSSLSRQIIQIEEELGFQLFERNKRNVKLTPAGQFLKENWSRIWDNYHQGIKQAKKIDEGSSGRVTISYPGSIAFRFLPELLKSVHKRMPDLTIELIEPPDENHLKLLLDFNIDIALSRDEFVHQEVKAKKLYEEPLCLVVPDSHFLNEENFIGLNQLENQKFIISRLHDNTFFSSVLRKTFARYEIEPQVIIESDFGAMILSLVSKNMGVSILPKSFEKATIAGVRFLELPEKVSLYANYRKNDPNKIIPNILKVSEEVILQF